MLTKDYMVHNELNIALQENGLFKNTDFSKLDLNNLKLNYITLKEGEILYQQDDQAHSIYLIIEGEINLIKKRSFGKTHSVVSKNSFLGHNELLMQTKRDSLAVALTDTQIAVIFEEDLFLLLSQENEIFNNIKDSLTELIPEALNKFEKKIAKYKKSNGHENIPPVIPLPQKLSEEKFDLIQPQEMVNKNSYLETEAEINGAIGNLNDKILELEKERKNIQSIISHYLESTKKDLSEVDRLKEAEKRLIRYDKEKNEILGKQSYRIIELEKAEFEFKNIELKLSKEIEDLSNQTQIYKIELQKLEQDLKDKEESLTEQLKINNELKEHELLYNEKNKEYFDLIEELKKKLAKVEEKCNNLKRITKEHESLINCQNDELSKYKLKEAEFVKLDNEKNKIIEEKDKLIQEINEQKNDLEKDGNKLSDTIAQLENDLNKQKDIIKNFNEIHAKILEENNINNKLIIEQRDKLKNLEKNTNNLSVDLVSKEAKLNELNEELTKKNLYIVDQAEQFKKVNLEAENLRKSILQNNDIIENHLSKINELQSEISNLKEIDNEKNDIISNQHKQIDNYENTSVDLQNKISEKEDIIKDYIKQIKNLQEEDEKNKLKIENSYSKIIHLNNEIDELKKLTTEIDELQVINKNYKENELKIEEKINNYTSKISELNIEIEDLQKSNEVFKKNGTKLTEEISVLSNEYNNLNNSLEKLSKELEEKNELIEKNENESAKSNTRMLELRYNQHESYQIIEEKNIRISELENEVEGLKNDLSNDLEIEMFNEQINNLNNELKLKNESYNKLNENNNILSEKIKNLELLLEEKDNSNNNLNELNDELNGLQTAKEKYKSEVDEKSKIIEDQVRQLEHLRSAKAEILKIFETANKNNQEKLKQKEDEIENLNKEIENIKESIEEKTFSEEQQIGIIENQVQKIADLELQLTELKKNKNIIETKEAASGDLEKEIKKYEKTYDFPIEEIDLIEEDPIPQKEPEKRMEIVDASKIEEVKSAVVPEKGKAEKDEDILSLSKHILTEPVNSFAEDGGFEHLQYYDVTIVNLILSRATMEYATKFGKFLKNILDSNHTKIVVNLSACEYIDSSILGVLVNTLKKASSVEGDLRIVWIDTSEFSMFHVTRMDKIFQIFDNLKDAVNSYIKINYK